MTGKASSPEVISYWTLRRLIGFLGLFLPIFLLFSSYDFSSGSFETHRTISAYYHHHEWVRDIFVGVLFAIAAFLFSYYGHTENSYDNVSTNIAGAAVLGVALFPTAKDCKDQLENYSDNLHLVFAAVFFSTLAYISMRLFTISKKPKMTKEKKRRNKVFRVCGIVIILMIVLSAGYFLYEKMQNPDTCVLDIKQVSPIFWFETIGLFAFAISWLVKGEIVMKDKN